MLEEEVLDTHKMVMDQTTRFLNDAHSVFSVTHEVDYDQEGKTVKPYLPIHDSKTLLYSIPYVPPRYRILLAYFAHPRIIHACTYASTRNESVYIYIYTFLLFSRLVQTLHQVYIYIYIHASLSYVIVPLYSFVSFPKRFKLFFFSHLLSPSSPFRISLFFVFAQWTPSFR